MNTSEIAAVDFFIEIVQSASQALREQPAHADPSRLSRMMFDGLRPAFGEIDRIHPGFFTWVFR